MITRPIRSILSMPGRRQDPAFPGQHTLHLDSRFETPSTLRTFNAKLFTCHREVQLPSFRGAQREEGGCSQRDQRDRVLAAHPGKEVRKGHAVRRLEGGGDGQRCPPRTLFNMDSYLD